MDESRQAAEQTDSGMEPIPQALQADMMAHMQWQREQIAVKDEQIKSLTSALASAQILQAAAEERAGRRGPRVHAQNPNPMGVEYAVVRLNATQESNGRPTDAQDEANTPPREMPDGVEWPKWSDGTPVEFGDRRRGQSVIDSIVFREGCFELRNDRYGLLDRDLYGTHYERAEKE